MTKTIVKEKIIRVIAGGSQTDFKIEEEEKAFEFFRKMSKMWMHASMYRMYYFERIEE